MRATALDRFKRHYVVADEGCWLWTAHCTPDGYGQFWNGEHLSSGGPSMVLAHRWAYEHFVGPIPAGHGVLHHCDVPPCVNPRDLFTGTQADNVADCVAKGRRNNRPRLGAMKLTDDEVAEIRRRYTGARGEQTVLAREFGVSQAHVSQLVGGRSMSQPSMRRTG